MGVYGSFQDNFDTIQIIYSCLDGVKYNEVWYDSDMCNWFEF